VPFSAGGGGCTSSEKSIFGENGHSVDEEDCNYGREVSDGGGLKKGAEGGSSTVEKLPETEEEHDGC
jgi:hypothetical protein